MVDPTGEEAWLVARAINFADSDHMFVVVADELGGEVQHQFLFGPEHGFNPFTGDQGAFGSLVALQGTETPTNADDMAAWQSLANGGADGVSITPINADDQPVIDAGQAVTQALGTPDNPGNTAYYPVTNPGTVSNGCNSNCGAYGTATRALQNDGSAATQSLPPGARTPGWGQTDHVLDEVDRQ